ncbi:MAG: hypothetical protein EX266_07215 [Rhodobacteraceae bacterium]|nr:MAG: hypothetical protein EX266_07215 [Paracoccaceae bacterium]
MSGYDQLASGETEKASEDGAADQPLRKTSRPVSSAGEGGTGLRVPSKPAPASDTPSTSLRVPSQSKAAGQPSSEAAPRKPRVCLMGEFSAGKSTLSNLLIGSSALPVNITATQLPPVWISKGSEPPYRVGLDGDEFDVDFNRLSDVSVQDTSHIRIFRDAKILEICDLIDMPGISDPNMAATVWQRVVHHADIVLWCSHATQAWRQSEAAVWSTMPHELHSSSLLLLTRMDRILSDRDRERVMRRVEKETKGLFRQVIPVSLLQALEAGKDASKWEESGAAALSDALVDLIDEVANGPSDRTSSRVRSRAAPGIDASLGEDASRPPKPKRVVMPTRVQPRPLTSRMLSKPTSRL